MSNTFWASDITWCTFNECPYKKCFRHLNNLPKEAEIHYSAAMLKASQSCPHKFDFIKEGEKPNGKNAAKKHQKK